jgi:L,D-peptidoglycan transpeptidase YkuD (ErfK/YbiS/YcfS/YnhG family)
VQPRATAALLGLSLLGVSTIGGCGSAAKRSAPRSTTPTHPTATQPAATTTRPASTSATVADTSTTSTVTTPVTVAATPVTQAASTTVPSPPPPAPLLVTHIGGLGSAQQAIVVATSGYGTSSATVTAYERGATGWKQVFGPWFAYVGRNGVAPAGAKREGDGRTPSGVYGFDFMFGINADPGVHYSFRRITGSNLVWDDDPASPNYNEWIDKNTAAAGVNPEPMYNAPSYYYGAVIAYNDARTPGLGSAIFLHVSHGSSTAGCVALPTDQLLSLLRWLDPARSPRIAIGTLGSFSG